MQTESQSQIVINHHEYKASNGFTRFPNYHQVATIALLVIKVATYVLLLNAYLPTSTQTLVITVLFYLSAVILVLSAYLTYIIDPVDSTLLESQSSVNKGFTCVICNYHVQNNSKHCLQCDKCVQGFDHHCKWINNCVGKKNYRYFIVMLISVVTVDGTQIAQTIRCYFSGFTQFKLWWSQSLTDSTFFILISISLLFSVCTLIACLILLLFHANLWRLGLSTYQYIRNRRKSKIFVITNNISSTNQ